MKNWRGGSELYIPCRNCILICLTGSSLLRLKHNCSFSNYKLLFPLTSLSAEASSEDPVWKCMICSAKTAWTKEPIIQHISKFSLYNIEVLRMYSIPGSSIVF